MTSLFQKIIAFARSFNFNCIFETRRKDNTTQATAVLNQPVGGRELEKTTSQTAAQSALDLQREIRASREFPLAEAIGREGGGFMKGESSIPRPLRATTQINQFITANVTDKGGAFSTTLSAWATNDIRVSRQLDTPLVALAQIIESTIQEPTSISEYARHVAIAHSKETGDRPYFQQLNQPPHPQAEYTHASIKTELKHILKALK